MRIHPSYILQPASRIHQKVMLDTELDLAGDDQVVFKEQVVIVMYAPGKRILDGYHPIFRFPGARRFEYLRERRPRNNGYIMIKVFQSRQFAVCAQLSLECRSIFHVLSIFKK